MTAMRRPKRSSGTAPNSFEALGGPLGLLANPTRLRILESLMDGVQCNCNLKDTLRLPMNLISHHLRILKNTGLVRAERDPNDARWIYYEIVPDRLAALRDQVCSTMDPARLRPRRPACGPPRCCEPYKQARRPRPATSRRSRS
jgi:ArsR family transcriptional regulator